MKKILLFTLCIGFSCMSFAQGDTCGTATELVCGGIFDITDGSTTGNTDTAGNSSLDGFYFFNSTSAQTITVSLCNTPVGLDLKLVVYSDCTLSNIIAENDDYCGLSPELSFQSEASSTYYIMVEGGDNPLATDFGDFKITLQCSAAIAAPAAPVGVDCSGTPSGATTYFTSELDAISGAEGTWTGDIVSGQGFGLWEFGNSSGADHSASTGPSAPFSGTSYMSYEASEALGGATTTVSAISPAIDLTLSNFVEEVELSFFMHAYGSGMGNLKVFVGNNSTSPVTGNGSYNDELFEWDGQFQSIDTQAWTEVGIDLSSFLGETIYLEFRHTGVGFFTGDMAIDLITVDVCDTVLSIEAQDALAGFTLYPNPVRDMLSFSAIRNVSDIQVYNMIGQMIYEKSPDEMNGQIDMSKLPSGVYIVRVKAGDSIGSYRIVKQ